MQRRESAFTSNGLPRTSQNICLVLKELSTQRSLRVLCSTVFVFDRFLLLTGWRQRRLSAVTVQRLVRTESRISGVRQEEELLCPHPAGLTDGR